MRCLIVVGLRRWGRHHVVLRFSPSWIEGLRWWWGWGGGALCGNGSVKDFHLFWLLILLTFRIALFENNTDFEWGGLYHRQDCTWQKLSLVFWDSLKDLTFPIQMLTLIVIKLLRNYIFIFCPVCFLYKLLQIYLGGLHQTTLLASIIVFALVVIVVIRLSCLILETPRSHPRGPRNPAANLKVFSHHLPFPFR